MTSPNVSVTSPDVVVAATDVSVTSPDVFVAATGVSVTDPNESVTSPDVYVEPAVCTCGCCMPCVFGHNYWYKLGEHAAGEGVISAAESNAELVRMQSSLWQLLLP